MAGLSRERKADLENGTAQTTNLAECLAIDQAALLRAVLPAIGMEKELVSVIDAHSAVANKGISHQIAAIGMAIGETLRHRATAQGKSMMNKLIRHPSDTVRSWAAFAATRADPDMSLADRLNAARIFAADPHFGVREWSWMAVRPHIASDINGAIDLLVTWTESQDPNVRRFAVESTRPRGVWCEHIAALKSNPGIALPLLEPLKEDAARYVQDSVANWLNDASKTAPAWVLDVCNRWNTNGSKTTGRIVGKAMRTLRKGS